jgi:hypothetical protein
MTAGTLADDAVMIRRARVSGMPAHQLREAFARLPVPPAKRFVFVRKLRLRGAPAQIGQAMSTAMAQLLQADDAAFLTFADFPALAVGCAEAALGGGMGAWHWRMLGVPALAGPGEALATLLCAHPLHAGEAVAALAARRMLAPVWRDFSEPAACRLIAALAGAGGFVAPGWPPMAGVTPDAQGADPVETALLERAFAAWAPALRGLPPRHEAVRAAALLALLRWSPMTLMAAPGRIWPRLLARLGSAARPAAPRFSEPLVQAPSRAAAPHSPLAQSQLTSPRPPAPTVPAAQLGTGAAGLPAIRHMDTTPAAHPRPMPASSGAVPHGEVFATGWGGVFFLINVLHRIAVAELLAACPEPVPTGWRLLHALGLALGVPGDDSLALFLDSQDIGTAAPPDFLALLLDSAREIYAPDGPWPLPVMQPASVRATETHLEVDFAAQRVDIEVRRAGLDLDPGWVPWLGRVVTFGYPNLASYFAA